jgi:hypothetical protein
LRGGKRTKYRFQAKIYVDIRWTNYLDELLQGELAVHVLVHLAEDLIGPLFWRGLVLRHLHDGAHLDTHAEDYCRAQLGPEGYSCGLVAAI